MLDRIRIENFQSHNHLELKPEGVTTIVGPSDVGKSAIVRALKWLCFNRPSGESFIRDGEDEAAVKVRIDGKTITRSKGKDNLYKLGKREYRSFGTDVPEPVSNVLHVDEVNFQGQHDAPYWFSETAGAVTRELNRIVDLSVIDESLLRVAQMVRHRRTTVEVSGQRLEELRREQEALSWVPQCKEDWDRVEDLERVLEERKDKRRALDCLVGAASRAEGRRNNTSGASEDAQKVVELGKEAHSTSTDAHLLTVLLDDIHALDEKRVVGAPNLDEMERQKEWALEEKAVREEFGEFLAEVEATKLHYLNTVSEYKRVVFRFNKEMGEECPLCGQPIRTPLRS